jgi:hypothetical protein
MASEWTAHLAGFDVEAEGATEEDVRAVAALKFWVAIAQPNSRLF